MPISFSSLVLSLLLSASVFAQTRVEAPIETPVDYLCEFENSDDMEEVENWFRNSEPSFRASPFFYYRFGLFLMSKESSETDYEEARRLFEEAIRLVEATRASPEDEPPVYFAATYFLGVLHETDEGESGRGDRIFSELRVSALDRFVDYRCPEYIEQRRFASTPSLTFARQFPVDRSSLFFHDQIARAFLSMELWTEAERAAEYAITLSWKDKAEPLVSPYWILAYALWKQGNLNEALHNVSRVNRAVRSLKDEEEDGLVLADLLWPRTLQGFFLLESEKEEVGLEVLREVRAGLERLRLAGDPVRSAFAPLVEWSSFVDDPEREREGEPPMPSFYLSPASVPIAHLPDVERSAHLFRADSRSPLAMDGWKNTPRFVTQSHFNGFFKHYFRTSRRIRSLRVGENWTQIEQIFSEEGEEPILDELRVRLEVEPDLRVIDLMDGLPGPADVGGVMVGNNRELFIQWLEIDIFRRILSVAGRGCRDRPVECLAPYEGVLRRVLVRYEEFSIALAELDHDPNNDQVREEMIGILEDEKQRISLQIFSDSGSFEQEYFGATPFGTVHYFRLIGSL